MTAKGQKPLYWTEAEEAYLVDHYRTEPWENIADHLGRTKFAIISRVQYIGLHRERLDRSPFEIRQRPLIARTCYKCGFFRMGNKFRRTAPGKLKKKNGHGIMSVYSVGDSKGYPATKPIKKISCLEITKSFWKR